MYSFCRRLRFIAAAPALIPRFDRTRSVLSATPQAVRTAVPQPHRTCDAGCPPLAAHRGTGFANFRDRPGKALVGIISGENVSALAGLGVSHGLQEVPVNRPMTW